MKKQVFTSQEKQNPIHTLEVQNMKKIITTLAIAAVIASSAFIINPSVQFKQAAQDGQAIINSYDTNLLMAGGNDNDWDGG